MKKKMTGKEIAKLAGVSPTTVSLVKKGKVGVSAEKRDEILQIMREHGYSEMEQTARKRKTVALLFRDDLYDLKQLFYNEIISCILKYSKDLPYNILVRSINYDETTMEGNVFSDCSDWDAAIICSDPNNVILCQLFQENIPFVVLDSSVESKLSCSVCVDYEAAAYQMTRYLLENGHRKLAYIGNARNSAEHSFTLHTFSGFHRAMLESGLSAGTDMICMNASDETRLKQFLDTAIHQIEKPTAIFSSTDCNAILSMQYLRAQGIRIPEEISIVGMDDISISAYTTPGLTTIHVDRDEMVRLCLELLNDILHGKHPKSVCITPTLLVERESVDKRLGTKKELKHSVSE